MASSGTYAFAPEVAEVQEHAFRLCGVDVATLTDRHSEDARFAFNLLFSLWATAGTMLFAVDKQTETTVDGTAEYTAATGTLALLNVTLTRDGIEMPVRRIDRGQYQNIPNKTNEGLPTQIFYDRIQNKFWIWNTAENSTDVITYWRLRRIQDINTAAETPDVPFEWSAALVYGLAGFLADIYAPEKAEYLLTKSTAFFVKAAEFNREKAPTQFEVN